MKVLIIAYACSPYRGSEPGVGWSWVKMIAEAHEAHVITSEFSKRDIKRWLEQHSEYKSRIRFYSPEHRIAHYHDRSKFWLKIEHSPFKILVNMAYRIWQRDAFWLARRLHRENDYDLCHLITLVGFRFPGRFYQLDCPFVWGPIGGLENTPWHFMPLLGPYGAAYYTARNLINAFDRKFLPGPGRAMQKAAKSGGIIAATSGIQKEIQKWYKKDSTVICEIGPPGINPPKTILPRQSSEPLKICWSGEHLPGKALPLLIQALAGMPESVDWRLDVLGAGPMTEKWQSRAKTAGIFGNCTFHGSLPRQEALGVMEQAHLFVITSLKDLTSTVLLEALSLGKPVIAPDLCGFSDVLTRDCGIRISIRNVDEFVPRLRKSICRIYENEALRRKLGQGALERVRAFDWDKKKRMLDRIYQDAQQMHAKGAKSPCCGVENKVGCP